MLSSTFSKFGEVDLVASANDGSSPSALTPPIFIQRSDDEITINGASMNFEAALKHIRLLHEQGSERAILSIADNLTSQRLVETMIALKSTAPLQLTVVK